jgi:lipopolysaccharide export system permease protein
MCIIDRYLLRKFVQTFLICFLSLFGLFVLIEVSANLEKFVRSGKDAGGVLPYIAHWYAYKTISFFENFSGLLALVSAMFTVSWIQRNNEMTALMAAGIPRIRVLGPLIIAVAVVSLLSAANRETLIPRYRTELARTPQDPAGDKAQSLDSCYDGRTNILLGGKHTFAGQQRIENPVFSLAQAPPALRKYGTQVTADNAYYRPPKGDRPGGYLFEGVHEPKNLDSRPSLPLNDRPDQPVLLKDQPVLITPHDAPWLKPGECFLVSDVNFDQLTAGSNVKQLSSTMQLIRGLHNPSLNYQSDVRVEIHARLIRPLLDMTLLFLGLPLIVTRENRNVFIAMGICIVVTVTFSVVVVAAQHLGGISFCTPALAAWAPLMIFVPIAVWLSESLWR